MCPIYLILGVIQIFPYNPKLSLLLHLQCLASGIVSKKSNVQI